MTWESIVKALEEYLKHHPDDYKLPQLIETWISLDHPGMGATQHPDTTHVKLVIEFRDRQLLWIKPEIAIKIR